MLLSTKFARQIATTIAVLVLLEGIYVLPAHAAGGQIEASELGSTTQVAPGESLTFSVKLLNFGANARADVSVTNRIFTHDNKQIYTQVETVAVDTTASFVRSVKIDSSIKPGSYYLQSSVIYTGQEVPAVSRFDFTVQRKIWGLFPGTLIKIGCVSIAASIVLVGLTFLVTRSRRQKHVSNFSYSDKPHDQIIFYEIISDTITQMRLRVGDPALEQAAKIPGLTIDFNTGKVLNIESDPANIMALLVLCYETLLGQRVAVPKAIANVQSADDLAAMNKNIKMVRKYFE